MGRFSSVNSLPSDVRKALNERLVQNNFGRHLDTSEWLKKMGYNISRSSIARYCLNRRAELTAQHKEQNEGNDYLNYRMKCLIAAASLHSSGQNSSSKHVLEDAQIFLDWLYEL